MISRTIADLPFEAARLSEGTQRRSFTQRRHENRHLLRNAAAIARSGLAASASRIVLPV